MKKYRKSSESTARIVSNIKKTDAIKFLIWQVLHMELTLTTTASVGLLFLLLCNNASAQGLELKSISNSEAAFQTAAVTFLPDWMGSDNDIKDMDSNLDTRWCEKNGYTYYSSGKCPDYYAQETCSRDKKYLKCDALKWCKANGYNTTTCSLPSFVDEICPNNQPYYKRCKEDTARACVQVGYKNTCSGGQKLHASTGRCSWNNSYGTCCSPSGCPSHTSLNGSYGASGSQDGCGYKCYYTCDMNCPSSYPYTYDPTGCSIRGSNGCGTKSCYQYKSCCTPSCTSDSGCSCGTYSVSNGCGGTCTKCSSCCNSSSSNWCSVHSTCHGNCCRDGSIASCDPRCGGSGCLVCSGRKPFNIGDKCSECRNDNDCRTRIFPDLTDPTVIDKSGNATYASRSLPFRYYAKCRLSTGTCVEALNMNDCKTEVDPYVSDGKGVYTFKNSPTAYYSPGDGACHCLIYYNTAKKETWNGDRSSFDCAAKSCSTDADCASFTTRGRKTYCHYGSGGPSNVSGIGYRGYYCVPRV